MSSIATPRRLARRPTLDDKVRFLRNPHSYPGRPARIESLETHFAWVFLTPRHAYKLKKPLRHASMDYRTLAARRRGCHDELRLNRRLAPAVYQCVELLSSGRGGALRLGRAARVEDYLVKMRRLPSSRMLDRAIARGAVGGRELDRLVRHLCAFFAAARRHPADGASYCRRLRSQVHGNRRALRRIDPDRRQSLVARVAELQLRCIERLAGELALRGARVVEGHGDLRAEHVHLGRPVCVIDCLEFDRSLRLLDPAEEMAFLALEIERLGQERLAWQLLRRFAAVSGERISDAALEFYMSHRAATRAKLAAWHVGDSQYRDPRPWIKRSHAYLRDALRHAQRARRALDLRDLSIEHGPALEQLAHRRTARHASQRLSKQRRHRQDGELDAG